MRKLYAFCISLLLPFAVYATLIHGKNSSNGDEVYRSTSGQMTITAISGEDQTNGVMKVEHQYAYCADKTADAACKASAGFVHTISCAGTDAAATAGSVALLDSTSAGAGTTVKTIGFAAAYLQPFTLIIDSPFSTGIYLDFTTTADVGCTVSYR